MASDLLSKADGLEVVHFLQGCPDPFSVVTAFEIACRHRSDPDFDKLAEALLPRLYNRSDPLVILAGPALSASAILTTLITARNGVFSQWPLYAKRLARLVHASHLVRLFRSASVDPETFSRDLSRHWGAQARLAELCDVREAPYYQPHHFGSPLIHAMIVLRASGALARIGPENVPDAWMEVTQPAIKSDQEGGLDLLWLAPGPLDEFEIDWSGLTAPSIGGMAETIEAVSSGDDIERGVSELIKLSVAFDASPERRSDWSDAIAAFMNRVDGPKFLLAAEIGLHLAGRWRDIEMSDRLLDILFDQLVHAGLADAGAAPRLVMMAAAAEEDEDLWHKRVGHIAQRFAYVQKPGVPSINLMRALDMLRDFQPDLGPAIASAKAFTILAYDRPSQPTTPTEDSAAEEDLEVASE